MPRKLKITFYLFFLFIFLPTLLFSIFEMGNYSHYEDQIEKVLTKSLNSAIYTINSYTDDVFNEWNHSFSQSLNKKPDDQQNTLNLLHQSPSVVNLFEIENGTVLKSHDSISSWKISQINAVLQANIENLNRLAEYYITNDYKKPEAFKLNDSGEILVVFVCTRKNEIITCGYLVKAEKFIQEVVGPKTQQTAEEDFIISIIRNNENKVIYNSDLTETVNVPDVKQDFWLLPGYSVGIALRSNTIEEIVMPRTQKFLYLSISVTIVLLFGVYMLFRSMRHQIELAQLKSEFISNVSHEIRTPLALIQMYIETLEMNRVKNEEKKFEYYSIIHQETARLSGIVNKILNFTRIEKGKREYQFAETDVNSIVDNVMSTYHFHLENKGFQYETNLSENLPSIQADKEALSDAVINLIDNAIKYSNEQKMIHIRTGMQHGNVYIEVKDFGIGISEKDQKNIFDKFYRVTSGDLALKAKGTGLGLTIVKHVMDAHHGEIEVLSKKGNGSSFKLLLLPQYI